MIPARTKWKHRDWHQLRLQVSVVRRRSRRVVTICFGPVEIEMRAEHALKLVDMIHDLLDEDAEAPK